jgi:predicted nucleic acid-binding protein
LDASALVIYITGEKTKVDLRKIIRDIERGRSVGFISTVNLAEFHRAISRISTGEQADIYLTWIKESQIVITSPTVETAVLASNAKQKYASKKSPFAWGDAFCLAAALEHEADYIVTTDSDFKKIKEIPLVLC